MVVVLGINDTHNGTACLLKDGKILTCISEERFSRIKNDSGLPYQAIEQSLKLADVEPNEVDTIALSMIEPSVELKQFQNEEKRLRAKTLSFITHILPTQITGSEKLMSVYVKFINIIRNLQLRKYKKYLLKIGFSNPKIIVVDHHVTHATSTYYFNNMNENPVLIFTCDGEGDGLCASVSIGNGNSIKRVVKISLVHSVGAMYSRVTKFLGMKPWEHEYKVMGLAPYANRNLANKTYEVFKNFLTIDNKKLKFENKLGLWGNSFLNYLVKRCRFFRFDAIAASIQRLTEEIVTKWIDNCINHFDIDTIALAGGVFMNVKLNKKIMEMDSVKKMFVFPSCADESTAIGVAMKVYADLCKQDGKKVKFEPLGPIYFGPNYDDTIEDFVKTIDKNKYKVEKCGDTEGTTSELLIKGEIVARCSGKMEFGARALGNRSILADPRNYNIVRTINSIIKKRDFWMPFTPTILKSREKDYIVNPKNIEAPYMILAFDTTDKRDEIIAAIHPADFTVRPQILGKEWNPKYWKIIKNFEDETGVGGILNTSFNLHGEPIVCSPKDAMHTLKNSGLKYLVMGNYLISKK